MVKIGPFFSDPVQHVQSPPKLKGEDYGARCEKLVPLIWQLHVKCSQCLSFVVSQAIERGLNFLNTWGRDFKGIEQLICSKWKMTLGAAVYGWFKSSLKCYLQWTQMSSFSVNQFLWKPLENKCHSLKQRLIAACTLISLVRSSPTGSWGREAPFGWCTWPVFYKLGLRGVITEDGLESILLLLQEFRDGTCHGGTLL